MRQPRLGARWGRDAGGDPATDDGWLAAVLDFDFVGGPDPDAKIWCNIEATVEAESFPTSHDETESFYFDLLHDEPEDQAGSPWNFSNSTAQSVMRVAPFDDRRGFLAGLSRA